MPCSPEQRLATVASRLGASGYLINNFLRIADGAALVRIRVAA